MRGQMIPAYLSCYTLSFLGVNAVFPLWIRAFESDLQRTP